MALTNTEKLKQVQRQNKWTAVPHGSATAEVVSKLAMCDGLFKGSSCSLPANADMFRLTANFIHSRAGEGSNQSSDTIFHHSVCQMQRTQLDWLPKQSPGTN